VTPVRGGPASRFAQAVELLIPCHGGQLVEDV